MASVRKREWTHNGEAKSAWVVAYTDGGGKRRIKTFDKKKDADRYRTQVETEIEKGEHVASRRSKRALEVAAEFLQHQGVRHKNGRIGRGRLDNIHRMMRNAIVPAIGNAVMSEMSIEDVETFYRKIETRGWSPGYVSACLGVLRQFFTYALRHHYVGKDVTSHFTREVSARNGRKIRTFQQQEISCLLATLEERPRCKHHWTWTRLKIWVHAAAFCGLRVGELAGLTVADVNTADRVIHVRRALTVYGELKGPKTFAGIRDVPMPPHLASMFDAWMSDHYRANPDELLFLAERKAKILRPGNLRKEWVDLLNLAGLKADPIEGNFHFHALRHFCASSLVDGGLPITDTAKLLGHAKYDLTLQVYAHPIASTARRYEAIDRIVHTVLPPGADGATA